MVPDESYMDLNLQIENNVSETFSLFLQIRTIKNTTLKHFRVAIFKHDTVFPRCHIHLIDLYFVPSESV